MAMKAARQIVPLIPKYIGNAGKAQVFGIMIADKAQDFVNQLFIVCPFGKQGDLRKIFAKGRIQRRFEGIAGWNTVGYCSASF